MIIEVMLKKCDLSSPTRSLLAGYNLSLKRYFKRIYSVRWSFEAARKGIVAVLMVHAYSGHYRVSVTGNTFREVLPAACDTVERQRRRRKRIAERKRRQTIRKPAKRTPSRKRKPSQSPEDFGWTKE